jgi:thiol:disulfide interchange protein
MNQVIKGMLNKASGALAVLLTLFGTALFAQTPAGLAGAEQSSEHVKARLIPETTTAVAGSTLWVALRLEHAEHWHTYWTNPGDAGKPTEMVWELPAGVQAGTIVWPTPERFELPGDLVDFGYTGEVFELIPLQVPADFSGSELAVKAQVNWLECEDTCIPGGAAVDLTIPVSAAGTTAVANSAWAFGFERTRASLPREGISLSASYYFSNGELNLLVQATEAIFDKASKISFIPDEHRVIDYVAPQQITSQQSSLQLKQKQHRRVERQQPARVGGLLLVDDAAGKQVVYKVEAAPDAAAASAAATTVAGAVPASSQGATVGGDVSLAGAFLLAFLGGLILNLMPCVFPVLSLKVLHLASSTHTTAAEQRMHGLSYMAGVMLSFLALAAVLLALQASGAVAGWGFHLQQPWFVAGLVFLFFVMGLSMSGVVEFGTSMMGVGTELQDKEGYSGSFFTGVLAAVVASPCTAPFMGAALGFAFTQPMPVALTVFMALGFGMALPFVVLSFVPALAKMMPRPGPWMLTFRQILAFPLYATVVWLLWVLGQQTDTNAMGLVAAGCVALAFACWLYQQRHNSTGTWRHVSLLLVLLCVGAAGSTLVSPFLQASTSANTADTAEVENYETYSAARLQALRAEGKPVFVNMTAAWCITCLVNERVALSADSFISKMEDKGVTYLKGDWTNNDPTITEVLKQYETSGVPLYLMFPADSSKPAEVLPQLLTEDIVLGALDRI